jgi:hypothetical protein
LPAVKVPFELAYCVVDPDLVPENGAVPAPPPNTGSPGVRAAELAHALAAEKYGMPPEFPATLNVGVLVPLATESRPTRPGNTTLVTVPVPGGLPASTRLPLPRGSITKAWLAIRVPLTVAKVVVVPDLEPEEGAPPGPPPTMGSPLVNDPEEAQTVGLEKYGIPPELPATEIAGVVLGVATESSPPAPEETETLLTVPMPGAPPESTMLPLASHTAAWPLVVGPFRVAKVVVFPDLLPLVGPPAPPPITGRLEMSEADEAQVPEAEK